MNSHVLEIKLYKKQGIFYSLSNRECNYFILCIVGKRCKTILSPSKFQGLRKIGLLSLHFHSGILLIDNETVFW